MWHIIEHRRVQQKLISAPAEVVRRYEKWKDIACTFGPQGVQAIKGNHDEPLRGKWTGYRSSRLGYKWRLIYQVAANVMLIRVVEVNAHDYRKH